MSDDHADGKSRLELLSPREKDIAELIASGLSNREIARRLTIAEGTVRTHVSRIYLKVGARSRVECALMWQHAADLAEWNEA
jgi:DNA-binding NarL/FixJ family response regulator